LHDTLANIAAGPFAAACLLLAFAGAAKLRRPAGTGSAAAAIGLPAAAAAVRALGAAEVIAAGAGLAVGGAAGLFVAAIYLGLAVAATRLLVHAPGTNCGCLGASDAPVSIGHVIVDGVAVVAALLASFGDSPLAAAGTSVPVRLAFLAATACCAWLAAQVLDALPALNRATRTEGAR
jgi:Methylamine utilisation protein MauE